MNGRQAKKREKKQALEYLEYLDRYFLADIRKAEEEAKDHYTAGYEDGTKARDGERGSIYYGGYGDGLKDGYEKGLQHGKELKVKEADCAYQCGMKRAWEADNIFIDELVDGIIGNMEPIEERPLGKWQRHYTRPGVYADLFWHCSNCGYKSSNDYADRYFKYCPGCGAKMVQPQESEEE